MELFRSHNEDVKKLVGISKSAATSAKYDRCMRRLEEFMQTKYRIKDITLKGEYVRIGELYGFPLLVKTEPLLKDGKEVKQNRFFVEGAFKYTYNNGQITMADTKAASMNFLNALGRIPKVVEQYKARNVTCVRDIPILQETVGGVWKKEDELKPLKSEVAALERKIQLSLTPPTPETAQENGEIILSDKCEEATVQMPNTQLSDKGDAEGFIREHVHIVRPKPTESVAINSNLL